MLKQVVELPNQEINNTQVYLYKSFIKPDKAQKCFDLLFKHIPWEQKQINTIRGKINIPRLTAWFGNNSEYIYSGIKNIPIPWGKSPLMIKLRDGLNSSLEEEFNTCLLNLYPNERGSVGWHSDDEAILSGTIASLSFGGERVFSMREIGSTNQVDILLGSGDLLIMKGKCQEYYQHAILKSTKPCNPRISLTFRKVV